MYPVSLRTTAQLVLLVYGTIQFAESSGLNNDYGVLIQNKHDAMPRSRRAFLETFIRSLRSGGFERGDDVRFLVPRDYSIGRYEDISSKRDYGINPPFHELCRMLNMAYCSYRS
ncbi:uncharacterized protein LOC133198904 [Saccostrea echinata]|uniref:uncharacterized protein LOC133198904 n=1 Tax=Saccostrea echinata TaxID=191078 RepID=UPI002A7EDD48|nr:uncharacterized protein LOC133198904 [Saccostrea echinata]